MSKATLTVQELASALTISMSTAYALVKKPDFPTIRIGNKILIPQEGLTAWLRENTGNAVHTQEQAASS